MKYLSLAILALLFITIPADAQKANLVETDSSWMTVEGTSTIHDWTADVNEVNATYDLNPKADVPVSNLSLTVPVKSIESGKGGMNRRIYDALKSGDHPSISFTMSSAERTGGDAESISLEVTGELTIAGVTHTVTLPVEGKRSGSNWVFTGSHSLNMTDYDMEPPTAMLGTIKSGEEVTIAFNLILNNSEVQ